MTNDYMFDYETTNKLLLYAWFICMTFCFVLIAMLSRLREKQSRIKTLQEMLASAASEIQVKSTIIQGGEQEIIRLHKKLHRADKGIKARDRQLADCYNGVASDAAVRGMQRKIDRQAKTISHLIERVNVLKSIIDDYEKRCPKS